MDKQCIVNKYETDEQGYYKHIFSFEELGEDWLDKPIGLFRMIDTKENKEI